MFSRDGIARRSLQVFDGREMNEPKRLICGCSFDGYEFTGCSEHAAIDELDDEDRCESQFGEDRCPNRAEYIVREPFTPAGFKQHLCSECTRGQVRQGYTLVSSPQWSFPELSERDNSAITKARLFGYASFFPCLNGGEVQALKTLAGAREFLEARK